MRIPPFAACVLAAGFAATAAAQTPPLGPEFLINDDTIDRQAFPIVVPRPPTTDFSIVWQSYGQDGSKNGIFAQRFDEGGTPLAGAFQVNSYTTDWQYYPYASADGAGNFVVIWTSGNLQSPNGQDGNFSGVFGQMFDAGGAPAGPEFQVNTYTTSYQIGDAVSRNASGAFVVVWTSTDQDGSSYGIFGQRYDSAGTAQGSEFQVNTHTTSYQSYGRVAVDPAGGFVVVWHSAGQDGDLAGIFGRRFDSAGAPLGGEFQVNTYTTNAQLFPEVAADPGGGFLVAWRSDGQDGDLAGIFARRYDAAGNPRGGEFPVNSYTTGAQVFSLPVFAADGSFLILFQSLGRDDPSQPSESGVYAQRFEANGARVGSEFLLNSYTTGDQRFPSATFDSRGQFVVCWQSYGQDGSEYGVFARVGGFPDARPMKVDERVSAGSSNVNGVLEPGEQVTVDPAFGDPSATALALSGTKTNLTGPAGGVYTIHDGGADYGLIPVGGENDCFTATADCYEVSAGGAPRPAQHWDAAFDEALSFGGRTKTWSLHLGDSFPDVPGSNPFYRYIETLFHNGVTGGCAGGNYCPVNPVTRAQMAVFLLKARFGSAYRPPAATGTVFSDVPASNPFAPWIENLNALAITGGCGGGLYCPDATVTRKQMAVFLLKTLEGSTYDPPDCVGVFADVLCTPGVGFPDWIEELYARLITGGCSASPLNYCPENPNNRGQMAVFLVKTFGLALYGPD